MDLTTVFQSENLRINRGTENKKLIDKNQKQNVEQMKLGTSYSFLISTLHRATNREI